MKYQFLHSREKQFETIVAYILFEKALRIKTTAYLKYIAIALKI